MYNINVKFVVALKEKWMHETSRYGLSSGGHECQSSRHQRRGGMWNTPTLSIPQPASPSSLSLVSGNGKTGSCTWFSVPSASRQANKPPAPDPSSCPRCQPQTCVWARPHHPGVTAVTRRGVLAVQSSACRDIVCLPKDFRRRACSRGLCRGQPGLLLTGNFIYFGWTVCFIKFIEALNAFIARVYDRLFKNNFAFT